MSFDTQFRKELKSMLSANGPNHSTISEREAKHVSWVSIDETDENKNKKQARSTPFPRKKATKDEINIKPTVLSFNDCFESMEDVDSRPKRRRKESAGEYTDFKKTLSKKAAVSSGLNNGWLEIDVSSPLNKSDSDVSTENVVVSEIDPSGQLAKEILRKIKENNIYNDISTTDESVQDEALSFSEVDQIELFNGDCFDSGASLNDSSSDSSSCENENIKVPKVVKNAKLFKKRCRIINGKSILDEFPNENFNVQMNQYDQMIETIEPLVIEAPKPAKKNKKNKRAVENSISASENEEKMEPDIKNNQQEEASDDTGSSDTEFLYNEIEENLDISKDYSFLTTEAKQSKSVSDSVQFYLSKKHSVLFLNFETKLYFCGKLSISVLSGAIEILGHVFDAGSKDIEVYSPKGQSYMYISSLHREKDENIEILLSNYNIKVRIDDLENKCVILVKNLESKLVNCLTNYSPKLLFPKVSSNHGDRPLSLLEKRLQAYFEVEPNYWPVLEVEKEWTNIFNSLEFGKKISLMACGGKGVGKSTFLRYMTNKLLQNFEKIVYIDLDLGQPEFTISGCISITIVDKPLLGPNFTHLKKPNRCCFFGEISISDSFTSYVNEVKNLMDYYRNEIDQTIPCIINYMGFTKYFGTDLIISLLPIICPNILVQIESDNKKHNFPSLLTADFVTRHKSSLPVQKCEDNLNYDLKVLKSVTSRTDRSSVLEPKVLRNLCTIAYFSEALETGHETISAVKPYCTSLLQFLPNQHIKHITESPEDVSDIYAIINGNLVALYTESSKECLGFGIVRGIDTMSKKIYIITPENSDVMEKVEGLVMGLINVPSSFYTTARYHEGSNPYICRTVKETTTSIPKRAYRACQGLLKK